MAGYGHDFALNLKGTDEVIAGLKRLKARFPGQVYAALEDEANRILKRSQTEFVPIDSTELKNSGKVKMIGRGSGYQVMISYGEDSPEAGDYALVVHEHPSYIDPPTWRGKKVTFDHGGPKYLEIPLRDAQQLMPERLAARLQGLIL